MQIKINSIEIRRRVAEQYRFPFFGQICFYAGAKMLKQLKKDEEKVRKRSERALRKTSKRATTKLTIFHSIYFTPSSLGAGRELAERVRARGRCCAVRCVAKVELPCG